MCRPWIAGKSSSSAAQGDRGRRDLPHEEQWVREARGRPALAGMKMQDRRVDRKEIPFLCAFVSLRWNFLGGE